MRVQIAARHCDIPDSVRQRTEEQISRLTRYDPGLLSAEVVYEEEKHTRKVEVILSVKRGEPVVAQGAGEEFRTALDKAVDRLGRMLRRRRSRQTDHQAKPFSEAIQSD